jgi:exopolysaccharide biosynthesis polyprenyl glycosylphosphotransferase
VGSRNELKVLIMYKQYQKYKLFLMAADVVLTLVVFAMAVRLRPFLPGENLLPHEVVPDARIYLVVAFLWHMLFAMTGVYKLQRVPVFVQQISRFTASFALAVLMFAGLLFFSFREVSRLLIIYFAAADYVVLLALRYGLAKYLRYNHGRVQPASVLIAGAFDSGIALAETITREHGAVLRVAGFVDDRPPSDKRLPAPFLGTSKEIIQIVVRDKIDFVVIALPDSRSVEVESLIYSLEKLDVRVYLVPDVISLAVLNAEVERFGELVVIGIREPVIQGHRLVAKRVLDLSVSTVVLLFTWPLMVAIWIAIKLDSAGPALFVAERVGENGKIFRMYKFRTMSEGAASHQGEVITESAEGRKIYKVKDDPRITRVGRWLRRTSLDELPQLFNVFKGEMSLVGPRPEQPFIAEEYDHWQWQRLLVPPGVTGWWQVSGRSDLPMHLNTQYDIFYVRNFSILLDLKILLKTLAVVVQGKGAY